MRPNVIFVDDEDRVLKGIERSLFHVKDYDFHYFNHPHKALKYCETNTPSVVITDMLMPDMDGIQFLQTLQDRGIRAPNMMLTGTGDLALVSLAINRFEISKFYHKPCDAQAILEGIRQVLHAVTEKKSKHHARNQSKIGQIYLDHHNAITNINETALRILGVPYTGTEKAPKTHPHLAAMIETLKDDIALTRHAKEKTFARYQSLLVTINPNEEIAEGHIYLNFLRERETQTPHKNAIKTFLSLTCREAEFLHALASSESIEKAAEAVGLTESSARTYLKRIFEKTGYTKQADLLKAVQSFAIL